MAVDMRPSVVLRAAAHAQVAPGCVGGESAAPGPMDRDTALRGRQTRGVPLLHRAEVKPGVGHAVVPSLKITISKLKNKLLMFC